jgi:hypothetical protein
VITFRSDPRRLLAPLGHRQRLHVLPLIPVPIFCIEIILRRSYTPAREDVGRNLRCEDPTPTFYNNKPVSFSARSFECTPLSAQYKLEGEAQARPKP